MAKRRRRRARQRLTPWWSLLVVVLGLFGAYQATTTSPGAGSTTVRSTHSSGVSSAAHSSVQTSETSLTGVAATLAQLTYHSGSEPVVDVAHNRSSLSFNQWPGNKVSYQNLDKLNRTSQANTAYLEPHNLANDSLRVRQYIQPTGWHQKFVGGEAILNRGHLIAYSLSKGIAASGDYQPNQASGDQNNPKNLFTQTAFSNQQLQTLYEEQVRSALRRQQRVIFRVQPIFRGQELMARGVWLQALSADHQLDFNVYIFNVQPGVVFDYSTGRSQVDQTFQVPSE